MAAHGKGKKLRTSEEVFNQLKWSGVLPADEFSIHYIDRFRGMMERPISEWVDDSTDTKNHIPWHRVQRIMHGDRCVWNREERLDLLKDMEGYIRKHCPELLPPEDPTATNDDNDNADQHATMLPMGLMTTTGAAKKQRVYMEPYWDVRFGFRFDAATGVWEEFHAENHAGMIDEEGSDRLRLLTYNILSDIHDADQLYSEVRYDRLLSHLEALSADIIALEEVQRGFLVRLLQQDWVRQRYFVTDSSDGTSLPEDQGQVLLSRLPIASVQVHHFGPHKHFLLVDCLLSAGKSMLVGACHLTSDRSPNCSSKQRQQLATIFESSPSVLLGDFNFGDADPQNELLLPASHLDVFRHLRPTDPGFTFAPTQNALAEITSVHQVDRRLDRILVQPEVLQPAEVVLTAREPFFLEGDNRPRFLSDHYGVLATCNVVRE